MSRPALTTRYRLRPGRPLQWRTWHDDSLVFDPASGDTHVFDAVAREGLASLEQETLDLDALTLAMSRRLDVAPDTALGEYAARLVVDLEALGLIVRVAS